MRCVALTGASGFIGSVLRQVLVREGFRLRALTRRALAPEEAVEWVTGSLEDDGGLARLVAGADVVIHCAGRVRGATPAEFARTNVEGSQRLMAAVRSSGCCERFLLISSLAARHPQLSWYAASKRAAEEAVSNTAGNLVTTVFRPTAVYGPGDRELRPLFEWLLRGWLFVPGPAQARFSFLHVADLAAAVRDWIAAPTAPGGLFELHDGYPGGYDWDSLAAIGARIRRRPVRRVHIPPPVLRTLAHVNLAFARRFGGKPMLTPPKLNELRHPNWSCDNSSLTLALGWEPQVQLAEALAERRF